MGKLLKIDMKLSADSPIIHGEEFQIIKKEVELAVERLNRNCFILANEVIDYRCKNISIEFKENQELTEDNPRFIIKLSYYAFARWGHTVTINDEIEDGEEAWLSSNLVKALSVVDWNMELLEKTAYTIIDLGVCYVSSELNKLVCLPDSSLEYQIRKVRKLFAENYHNIVTKEQPSES